MIISDNSFPGVGDTVSGVTGGLGKCIQRPVRMAGANFHEGEGVGKIGKGDVVRRK